MSRPQICPFIELPDPRCARRLSLGRLCEAFKLCVNCPTACPVYHELRWRYVSEQRAPVAAVVA